MKNLLLALFFIINLFSFGQVTLLDPAGDGGFETGTTATANGWTATVGTGTQNQWIVGSAYAWGGSRGAYITNNTSSAPNSYNTSGSRVTHLYRNFTLPTNTATATLSFYWKGTGESNLDFMRVYFEPAANAAPVYGTAKSLSGTAPTGIVNAATASSAPTTITRYQLQSTSQLVTITIPSSYFTNTAYRLTFEWRNDISAGVNPPAAIDNVSITYTVASCASPTSLTSSSVTTTTSTISWTAASPAPSSGYQYFLSTSSSAPTAGTTPTGSTAAGVTSVNLSSLNSGTQYYFWVRSNCGGSQSTWAGSSTFTTTIPPPSNDACSGATNLPCGTSGLAGTTVGAVSETAPNSSTLGTMGVWYSFAGTDQQTTITVVQSLDTRLLVLTSSTGACGGTYTTIANVDNITSSNETATFAANSGTTYFVYIGYYTNGANTGTFTISRSCTTSPSNNNCSGATALTVNSGSSCTTSTNGTTVGATQSSTACSGTADDDVWYSFVANGDRQTLTVTPGTLTNAVLQVYSGSCAGLVSLACVNNTTGSSAETVTVEGLVAGTTYFVRVHSNGNGTGQGTFTICATTPCTTPTTAGTLTANKTSTVVNDAVVYTTSGNAGSITKLEWSYDNFTTVAGTQNNPANPFTMWWNVQQSIVYVRTTSVSGSCPAGITTPVAVNLSLAPEYVYGTSSNDYITNVTLNTINNNSTYDVPQGYDSYQDFTSISTTLVKGSTYTISVSSTMTYSNYSGYVAWIDYNNNGIFEVSENIMQQAPGATRSQSFTVPSTSSTALVTLRVLSAWAETPSTDAYYSVGYDWGEIEEYKINITAALPVELSTFNGINKGSNNYLYWITVSEQNTSHFNLQKSRDGETWTTITTLNAAGNSINQIDYDVTDYDVEPIINYYRLQQYDNDGVYEMFGPISINNLDSKSDKTIIKYINLNGQEIDPSKLKSLDVYIEVYNDGTMRKIIK